MGYEDVSVLLEGVRRLKFRSDTGMLFDPTRNVIHRIEDEVGLLAVSLAHSGYDFESIVSRIYSEYDVSEQIVSEDIYNLFYDIVNSDSPYKWEWDIEKKHGKLLDFPLRIEIELTSLCNWNCGFCYNVWKIDPNATDRDVIKKIKSFPNKHMPKEKVFKILDECAKNNCFIVRYSGGETLLHPDIEEILAYGGKLGLYQCVFTNGHFLTPELAKKFKEYNVGTVLISLHGDRETHNRLTGHKSAYDRATRAIELLVSEGIEVVAELCLVKENLFGVLDVIQDVYSRGGRHVSVMRYVPTGKNDDRYGVPYDVMMPLMREIDKLQNKFQDLVVAWPCGQKMCTSDVDIPLDPHDSSLPIRQRQLTGHCEAGLTWASVSFDGQVRNCPHSNVYFGSVEEGLKPAWKRLTQKVAEVLEPRASCSGCSLLDSCRGGCHLRYFFQPATVSSNCVG